MDRLHVNTKNALVGTVVEVAFATIALLAACGGSAWAQSSFQLSVPSTAKPGETFYVDVSFDNRGDVGFLRGGMYPDWRLRLPPQGTSLPSSPGAMCRVAYDQILEIEMVLPRAPARVPVCRVPVTVQADAVARRFAFFVSGSCAGSEGETAFPCSSGYSYFTIDGPAPWIKRNLVVVPREAPNGPAQSVLTGFDYASASPSPLGMFESPRPRKVERTFATFPLENAYLKGANIPNAAVAGLLRSVRATYLSPEEKLRGASAAADDSAVEGVVTAGATYGLRTYPERPRAGEPFALWYTDIVCTPFRSAGYNARTVTVSTNDVFVEVPPPTEPIVDFAVCPGGEFHFLWNMPGLPEGMYRLRLGIEGSAPPYEWPSTTLTVQGALPSPRPREIPSVGAGWLALLSMLVLATGGFVKNGSKNGVRVAFGAD